MKLFYRYIICGVALVGTLPLYAQLKPTKSLAAMTRKAGSKIAVSKRAAAQASIQRYQQLLAEVERLKQEDARLQMQLAQQNQLQARIFDHTQRAIFRALPTTQGPVNSFTGTVFQIEHNGKKEIFGVIAAHTLQDGTESPALVSKHFTALVVKDGEPIEIPAQVVQVSSPSMADLALVKFRPVDEALFDPMELTEQDLTFPMQVYSQGYACNLLSRQAFQITSTTSTGVGTGHIPAAREGDRAGFCGSPLVNEQEKLAGIHIGSSYKTSTGYMAPAARLRELVENYHNEDATPVSIKLAGREIAQLAVNDYIKSIELLDAKNRVLWRDDMYFKFSLRRTEEELARNSDVAFIRLTVGQVRWAQEGYSHFLESDEYYPDRIVIHWSPGPEIK